LIDREKIKCTLNYSC